MSTWLLYGANGYTGRLIVREAAARGLRPIVAGRDVAKVAALAAELDLPSRTFALDDDAALEQGFGGVEAVLNCAGPFVRTAPKLIEACLASGVHYLDITGEIDVLEHAHACDAAARAAGAAIIPAVGFDVVPTDCLAALLVRRLPDASHLALAFHGSGTLSPGTMKTALEGAADGGRARVDGRIVRVPFAWKTRAVPFADGVREAQTIPWGDVASAYYTTGIPNIETYLAAPANQLARMRRLNRFAPLLRFAPLRHGARRLVERRVKGPTEDELQHGRTEVWGEVRNATGRIESLTLTTPNAYRLTVLTALAAVERVLNNEVAPGFQTPSQAFGAEFILSFDGVRSSVVSG